MYKVLNTITSFILALIALLLLAPAAAWASGGAARTDTVAAGPYIIDVNFAQDPPYVDQPLALTIVPHNTSLRLNGQLTAQPGLGTDATNLQTTLSSAGDTIGTLKGSVQMPVKGAWNIKVHLNGPQGPGDATIPVTVGSPGAMRSWLAWLIGSLPVIGVIFWIFHQHNYRKKLTAQQSMSV